MDNYNHYLHEYTLHHFRYSHNDRKGRVAECIYCKSKSRFYMPINHLSALEHLRIKHSGIYNSVVNSARNNRYVLTPSQAVSKKEQDKKKEQERIKKEQDKKNENKRIENEMIKKKSNDEFNLKEEEFNIQINSLTNRLNRKNLLIKALKKEKSNQDEIVNILNERLNKRNLLIEKLKKEKSNQDEIINLKERLNKKNLLIEVLKKEKLNYIESLDLILKNLNIEISNDELVKDKIDRIIRFTKVMNTIFY
jgi:hypothetical protein